MGSGESGVRARVGSWESRRRSGVGSGESRVRARVGSWESRRRSRVEGQGRVGSRESGQESGLEGPESWRRSGVGARESRAGVGRREPFPTSPAGAWARVPGTACLTGLPGSRPSWGSTPQEPVCRPGDRCGMRNGEKGREKKRVEKGGELLFLKTWIPTASPRWGRGTPGGTKKWPKC